ncbi:MAG: phosphatidylserine/phosphatidylglycerophosphate/cardiolipin synthase family protein [Phycisphaerae bacterium]|nr:phosphatidylserine/phosphatidylglycerophosphate/cardiolipin synthase family protein [Phycisphaerae bacterium]
MTTTSEDRAPAPARRDDHALAQACLRRLRDATSHGAPPVSFMRTWTRTLRALVRLGGLSDGNAVSLSFDGDACFDSLWRDLAEASKRIWMEMYLIEPDRAGMRTLHELARAAERGCDVRLVVDAVGSSRLTEAELAPLRDAGVRVEVFNPISRLWRGPALLQRNHRKLVVIDDRIGYCGGMNVSEDYAGPKHGNGLFHDARFRLEGPSVHHLASVFATTWKNLAGEQLDVAAPGDAKGDVLAQVLSSSGRTGRRAIQRMIRLTIHHAVRSCSISMAYAVPPLRITRAMSRAASRGVDVRILTAGVSDVPLVRFAAQSLYGALLRNGVRVYEMVDQTLHAKTVAIDGVFAAVGSFNFDTWSDARNLEVMVAVYDPQLAGELTAEFERDIEAAREVKLEEWTRRSVWQRFLSWVAYRLMRL